MMYLDQEPLQWFALFLQLVSEGLCDFVTVFLALAVFEDLSRLVYPCTTNCLCSSVSVGSFPTSSNFFVLSLWMRLLISVILKYYSQARLLCFVGLCRSLKTPACQGWFVATLIEF